MCEATKKPSRWGGECYDSTCPFHEVHFGGEEPHCHAQGIELTEEEYQSKAVCLQERKELGL